MTIFNKDGKVYVLEGPNPLMEKQVSWDRSKLNFHNFHWNEISIKGGIRPKSTDPKPVLEEPHEDDQPEYELEENHDETPASPTKQERDFDLPYIKHKVLSYCLPAKVEIKKDNFYGESWTKVKYGKKMVFPSVMIDVTDFEIEFWTSDPKEQISEKSIIYPFAYEVHNTDTNSYDRVPYDEYRWWKVATKEKREEGGWLFTAVPSDSQPDFSDD